MHLVPSSGRAAREGEAMTEMIERVARAIHARMKAHEKEYVDEFNGILKTKTHCDGYFDLNEIARAVIEAMCEPTKSMLKADMGLGGYGFTDGECYSADPREVWQAMIGAALDEAEPKAIPMPPKILIRSFD